MTIKQSHRSKLLSETARLSEPDASVETEDELPPQPEDTDEVFEPENTTRPRPKTKKLHPEPRGPPRLLRMREIEQLTGLKKTQIFDAVSRGVFPKPIKILETGRAIAWLEHEVAAHIEARVVARDRDEAA